MLSRIGIAARDGLPGIRSERLHYNTNNMLRIISKRLLFALGLAGLLASIAFTQSAKRPLNHKDYDGWRTIASQHLSADGKFLAYGVFPQEGDGEVIVRNLVTGQDSHFPAGARPQPTGVAIPEEGPAPEARGTTITFSADSKYVVFSTFPSKADTDKARKDRRTGDNAPKDGMVIVELATAKATTIERVRRFAMPEKISGYLAYQKEAPETPARGGAQPGGNGRGDDADQQGRGGRGLNGDR